MTELKSASWAERLTELSTSCEQAHVDGCITCFRVFDGGGIQRHVEGTNSVDCAPVDEPVLPRQLQGSGVAAGEQIRLEPRFGSWPPPGWRM